MNLLIQRCHGFCGLEKPLNAFHLVRKGGTARRNICKSCYPLGRRLALSNRQPLLEKQGHKCLACKKPFTDTPAMDHCHQTGRIRGLLHQHCNKAEGMLTADEAYGLFVYKQEEENSWSYSI
jgi:hypothetical protein